MCFFFCSFVVRGFFVDGSVDEISRICVILSTTPPPLTPSLLRERFSVPTQNSQNKTPKVVSVGCVGLWKHNGGLSEFAKIRETGKMCHVMSIDE